MITSQKLTTDEKGNYTLSNTCSILPTLAEVRKTRELNPGGRFGDKNHECVCMGYIPPEFYGWHWLLKEASKARMFGDPAKAQELEMKFFKLYPEFSIPYETKYWQGSKAVLL